MSTVKLEIYRSHYRIGLLVILSFRSPKIFRFVRCTGVLAYCYLSTRVLSWLVRTLSCVQDDGVVLRTLPNSLKMKFTQNKYSRVFEQNTFLFRGCNTLFLNQITVKLKEFYLMPGETMLRQGEMPRELCFVKMVRAPVAIVLIAVSPSSTTSAS